MGVERRHLVKYILGRIFTGAAACQGCKRTRSGLGEIRWRGGRVQKGGDCQVPKAFYVRFEGGLEFGSNGIEVGSVRG
jgi:hypothetical protein